MGNKLIKNDFGMTKPVYILKNGRSRVKILTEGARMDWWMTGKERRAVLFNDNGDPPHCTHPCAPIFGALSTERDVKNNMQYKFNGNLYRMPPQGFLRDVQWSTITYIDDRKKEALNSIKMQFSNIPGRFNKGLDDIQDKYPYVQYPFYYRFDLIITLIKEDVLQYRLGFTNMDNGKDPKAVPLDMASQIYFPWQNGMKISGLDGLTYNDETDWEMRANKVFRGDDFGDQTFRDWHFCGTGEKNIFTISYPDQRRVHIILRNGDSGTMPQKIVTWTDPHRGDFLGFTPVLRGRNSFNSKVPLMVKPGEEVWLSYFLQAEGY